MAARPNRTTLRRYETLLREAGFTLRFEKGRFQSAPCRLHERRVVVLNRFLPLEGQISSLVDILRTLEPDLDALSPASRRLYEEITQAEAR